MRLSVSSGLVLKRLAAMKRALTKVQMVRSKVAQTYSFRQSYLTCQPGFEFAVCASSAYNSGVLSSLHRFVKAAAITPNNQCASFHESVQRNMARNVEELAVHRHQQHNVPWRISQRTGDNKVHHCEHKPDKALLLLDACSARSERI
jgi:hypothetical protein